MSELRFFESEEEVNEYIDGIFENTTGESWFFVEDMITAIERAQKVLLIIGGEDQIICGKVWKYSDDNIKVEIY